MIIQYSHQFQITNISVTTTEVSREEDRQEYQQLQDKNNINCMKCMDNEQKSDDVNLLESQEEDFINKHYPVKIYVNKFETDKKKRYNQNRITTTKYTPYNFIFKFLLEFYCKLYNIFVLVVALLNQLPFNGVVSPATSFLPIAFVIIIALIREILEDVARRQQDNQQNNIDIIATQSQGHLDIIKSKDIMPGQLIIIKANTECPSDCLLIENCDNDETFISTASIDGETSLKPKLPLFNDYDCQRQLNLFGTINVEKQSTNIQKMSGITQLEQITQNGVVKIEKQFNINNVILKGSIVKSKVVLIPLYTGQNTKIIKCSSNVKEKKESILEHKFTVLTAYIVILVAAIMLATGILASYATNEYDTIEYIFEPQSKGSAVLKRELQVIIIVSYFIPISLLVTLELTRFLQSIQLSVDQKMRVKNYKELNNIFQKSTVIRTSQTIDNLIETNIIFSDKTGTLTKNEMVYRQRLNNKLNIAEDFDEIELFLTGICHQVQIRNDISTNKLQKQGESPDELALLKQCDKQEFLLSQRDNNQIQFKYKNNTVTYDIKFIIPFDASYKYMAICVQEQQNYKDHITPCQICEPFKPFFVIKGADNVISQMTQQDQIYQEQLMAQITQACTNGFRVLMYAYKQIDEQNLQFILQQWNRVKNLDVTDESRLQIQKQITQNLIYSHCTFVEDKLQDDTTQIIKMLQQNDIKMWMLTGDRTTTALAIAQYTGLCSQFDKVYYFTNCTENNYQKTLADVLNGIANNLQLEDRYVFIQQISKFNQQKRRHKKLPHNKDYPSTNCVIVIDSESLRCIIQNKCDLQKLILAFLYSKTVVATRLSPEQKAQLVDEVKHFNSQIITTAMGDGQNDVAMIKKANIGIGVCGKEGNAASMNSDISIPSLSYLQRLFKQSRCCSQRNSTLIGYSIYKNSMISFINLIYQQYCTLTFQLGMDQMIIMMYNTILTFIVIFVYSITEFDVSFKNFDFYPYIKLYRNRPKIDLGSFCRIMILGLAQSLVIVYTSYYCFKQQPITTVQLMNSMACLFTVLVDIPMKTHTWNFTVLLGWILTFIALFLTRLYSNYLSTFGTVGLNNYTEFYKPGNLLYCVIATCLCCVPEFVYYFWHIFTRRTIEDKFVQAQAQCVCIRVDE